MKVLLYGGNGWIGKQFIELMCEHNIEFLLGVVRVDQMNELIDEIVAYNPTHIVSFIGRTHGMIDGKVYPTIDYLEQKGKLLENVRDNLFSPIQLAVICGRFKIHLTYLGTGCIFSYDEMKTINNQIGFTESDEPNFFESSYSVVKGMTDRMMHLFADNTLNLRIRMPINADANSRNFITKITTYARICSIENSMSVLPDLLPLVIDMMRKKITGTVNLTNPGKIQHNEILEMYRQIVDPTFTWTNFTIEEQSSILAAGRSNNYLDTTLLETMYPNLPDIHTAVMNCLHRYPKPEHPFWNQSMVLLVTGGYGFIGSNFINWIVDKYPTIRIINFDALYYCADILNVNQSIRESPNYTFIHGNLCDQQLVEHMFNTYKPTHVIHFAAQSHVQNSFNDSLLYTKDNVMGTHVLLESCRLYGGIRRFIHVSTDEVYGESLLDKDEKHKTEQSILCPTNPYAATKAGAELIAQSYAHSYRMPIIITRGNNVYGPNQYPEKLIPRFIELLKASQPVTIQGDGSNLRSFLHVTDTVCAFEKIMEFGKDGEIYNIGCDNNMEYSVLEVARILINMIHGIPIYDNSAHEKWIKYIDDRPFNDKRYLISNQKLKDIGWSVTIQFMDGLQSLVDGYGMNKK